MRYLQAFCLSVAVAMSSAYTVSAQGDSDPGFGTLGCLRPGSAMIVTEDEYEFQRAQFSISHTFSHGEKDVILNMPQLDVMFPIMEDWNGYIHAKVPVFSVSGDLARRWGMGDPSIGYTQVFKADPQSWTLQATAGALLGMGVANASDGNARPLPMAYQSSLGSTDAIVGVNATWKEYISISAGYQQPILRYNDNDYYRSTYINDPVYSNSQYTIARHLYRQGDVMMRLEGRFAVNRAGISASAMGIYHLAQDLYEDRMGYWRKIDGSDGLTVNGTCNVFVRFGRYGSFKLDVTGTVPFIRRDVIPDGLNRQWTITPRFTFFFNQRTLLF